MSTNVPMDKAGADALLASWRCCGAPGVCGARCMDDEESHRLAQFAAYIDNERVNESGLRGEVNRIRVDVLNLHQRCENGHCSCGALHWPCSTARAVVFPRASGGDGRG